MNHAQATENIGAYHASGVDGWIEQHVRFPG